MFSVDLKLGRLEDMGDMSMETLKNSLPLNMASSSFFFQPTDLSPNPSCAFSRVFQFLLSGMTSIT